MKLEFETLDVKADANLQAHGVSFELAKTVFKDPFAVERLDDREDYGEERFVVIGMAEGNVVLFVAYTEREERIRIISARRATQDEEADYVEQKQLVHRGLSPARRSSGPRVRIATHNR